MLVHGDRADDISNASRQLRESHLQVLLFQNGTDEVQFITTYEINMTKFEFDTQAKEIEMGRSTRTDSRAEGVH